MLCDEIVHSARLAREYPGIENALAKISKAHKFALAADFAAAADGLVGNKTELLRIAPFCRLPFPLTWIEVAQAERPHWLESPTHFPGVQGKPLRVGFLLEGEHAWTAQLFWSLKTPAENPPEGFTDMFGKHADRIGKHNASVIGISFDPAVKSDDLVDFISVAPTVWGERVAMAMMRLGILKKFNQIAQSDWGGELQFIVASLGLLNARNVVESEPVERGKLNKARAKRGEKPLYEYKVLKVRAAMKARRPSAGDPGGHRELRAHFVMGHFKRRKSGIFWWSPHMRGERSKGFVEKQYEVAK